MWWYKLVDPLLLWLLFIMGNSPKDFKGFTTLLHTNKWLFSDFSCFSGFFFSLLTIELKNQDVKYEGSYWQCRHTLAGEDGFSYIFFWHPLLVCSCKDDSVRPKISKGLAVLLWLYESFWMLIIAKVMAHKYENAPQAT